MSRVAPSSRSPAPGPPRLRSATTERRCVHTTCRFAGLVSASALRSVHTPITEQRLEFWRDEELSKPGRCPALRAPQSARVWTRLPDRRRRVGPGVERCILHKSGRMHT